MNLDRWTPVVLLFPRRYLDLDYPWHQFSITAWNYDWREDPWGGLWDTLKPPAETVQDGRGDCEDYAFVVASALCADSSVDHVELVVAGKKWRTPSHVAVYADGRMYSSGQVTYGRPSDWLARTHYDWVVTRKL